MIPCPRAQIRIDFFKDYFVVSEDTRNLLLAVGLSLLVFIGWDRFVMPRFTPPKPIVQQATTMPAATGQGLAPDAAKPVIQQRLTRAAALTQTNRVKITAPKLSGSLNLRGAQFDDLILTKYNETIEKNSGKVMLLQPAGTPESYFAQFGWFGQNVDVPNDKTIWQASSPELTPAKPVTLFWENGKGQRFEIDVAVDTNYLFTITQKVRNTSTNAVVLQPFGLIQRIRPDHPSITSASHEGLVGAFEKLEEHKYADMKDADKRVKTYTAPAAWLGFTDKYWLTALIPDVKKTSTGTARNLGVVPTLSAEREIFQTDMAQPAVVTRAGAVTSTTSHFFAGAKEVKVVEAYNTQLGAKLFDRAIDWGWFWYFTKPFFWILDHLFGWFGNFGLAIIGLTFIVKALFFPIATKQYESFAKMKLVQPKMKEIQEKFKDDKPRQQQEMMELYKREKVNPLGGCLPIVLQIPVFFALYKVVFVSIEARHQPFFGWIKDLSVMDPLTPVNLFNLLPFTPPTFGLFTLAIGVLPIIMGITMFLQQKMQPMTGVDPAQAQVMKFMPIMFTAMMASFASGVVLYWITNNLLSIAQQKWITARIEKKQAEISAAAQAKK
jgi:YidC/Oxa1 family membrane protein insertase